jgi:hypothetical protein
MKALAWLLAALLIVGAAYYHRNLADVIHRGMIDAAAEDSFDPEKLDRAQIDAQQHDAAAAALQAMNQPPASVPLRQRPAYVSRLEWQILRHVADSHNEPEKELVRMVNFLRFSKQLEWWQHNLHSADRALHEQVAEHLLDDIPERVRQQDMSIADAQQLQMTLLTALLSDADLRRQRMQQEAERIGVTFRIRDALHSP